VRVPGPQPGDGVLSGRLEPACGDQLALHNEALPELERLGLEAQAAAPANVRVIDRCTCAAGL
jgi:hypothetical protein